MTALKDFLAELAVDPQKLGAFIHDPDGAMKAAELSYPLSHIVTIYEAAMFPNVDPLVVRLPLQSLSAYPVSTGMTLYIPPCRPRSSCQSMGHIVDPNMPCMAVNWQVRRSWTS